ncbi:MAG: hypothetical protein U0522_02955 [Candidatus Paceibacterota bacterium]
MATEARKKAETVREKIAASLIEVFGIEDDLADAFVRNDALAFEAHVDTDMLRGAGASKVSMSVDPSAIEEFYLDVSDLVGVEISSTVIDQQIKRLEVGRLKVSDLIKGVEDAVEDAKKAAEERAAALGVIKETPEEKKEIDFTGIPHWET